MIEDTLIKIADNYSLSKLSDEELIKRGYSRDIIKNEVINNIRSLNREESTIFFNMSAELKEKLSPFGLDDFYEFIDDMMGNSDKDDIAQKLRRTIMLLNDIIIEYNKSFMNKEDTRKIIMKDMETRILDLLNTIYKKKEKIDIHMDISSTPLRPSYISSMFEEEPIVEVSDEELEEAIFTQEEIDRLHIEARIRADLSRMGEQFRGNV